MATPEQRAKAEVLALGRGAKGLAAVGVVRQALDAPALFTFAELLDLPNIQALQGTPHQPFLDLLRIFSFGTYLDYKSAAGLPELTPQQANKLKQLTIVTLAERQKSLSYETLLAQLDVPNVRALEDLIIGAIYQGIIGGKLDQKARSLEIETTMGRDLRPGELDQAIAVLERWYAITEDVVARINVNIQRVIETNARLDKDAEAFEAELERTKLRVSKRAESGGSANDSDRRAPSSDFSSQEYFDEDFRNRGGNKTRQKKASAASSASVAGKRGPPRS